MVYFNPPAPCGAGPRRLQRLTSLSINFNPPAPCGAGPRGRFQGLLHRTISIHPPRAGRDPVGNADKYGRIHDFNPPAPCGAGRHWDELNGEIVEFQSTRPVRGGTGRSFTFIFRLSYFNPPAPCGAGPWAPTSSGLAPIIFQSTRPVRGGTQRPCKLI